jgi:hypothetical protein
MTKNSENTPAEPPEPRKKGGGDGNAKSATPKSRPAEPGEEMNPADTAAESAPRSRKITTRNR